MIGGFAPKIDCQARGRRLCAGGWVAGDSESNCVMHCGLHSARDPSHAPRQSGLERMFRVSLPGPRAILAFPSRDGSRVENQEDRDSVSTAVRAESLAHREIALMMLRVIEMPNVCCARNESARARGILCFSQCSSGRDGDGNGNCIRSRRQRSASFRMIVLEAKDP